MENIKRPLWDDPRLVWGALICLWAVGLVRRITGDFVPGDFTAYLSAADMFVQGLDPYSDARFEATRYDGFPYNYFPGTLWLIAPMAYLSTTVAVCVDWVARAAALVGTAIVLRRRVVPELPWHHLAVVMLLHEPLVIDQLVGNMVTYLLAAWALCLELSYRRESAAANVAPLLAGVVLTFKPFWLIPAGWIFVTRRQWARLGALTVGTVSSLAATLAMPAYWETFSVHTAKMRDFYFSVDFLSLFPPAFFVLLPASAFGALWFWRRFPSEWVFLLGCVSVPVWPRVATYSYAITLPVTLYLMRRFGALKGLAFSVVTVGPLPWVLRDAGILPGEQLENWVMFVWVIGMAVWMARHLAEVSKEEETWASPN